MSLHQILLDDILLLFIISEVRLQLVVMPKCNVFELLLLTKRFHLQPLQLSYPVDFTQLLLGEGAIGKKVSTVSRF